MVYGALIMNYYQNLAYIPFVYIIYFVLLLLK